MLWYLLKMMMYPAWKKYSDSEKLQLTIYKNLVDKNIGTTCDTLLIEDMFVNSDMSIYNLDIQYTSFEPYLKVINS